MSRPKSRIFFALALILGATLAGGAFAGKLHASPEREAPSLDEYADILTTLSEWAPESIPPDKIVYASIHGMLARLDPHTAFLEPDEFSAMKEKQHGSFYGLGIQIQKRMGKITVIAPMEGTPAYKMGVRAGDVITHIGDEELKDDVSTDDVVRKLRGPKGTAVTIRLRRVGFPEPIVLTITRAEIPTKSVRYAFMLEPGVGYVMLSDFTHTSSKELYEAIEKLRKQGMKKLLFDLRGNPGGVLEQAVDVTDVFVPKGDMVVYTKGRTASSAQEYYAPGDGPHFDQPLVVLVNRGSASASEIVAGAIQDHDRGLIVGQRTWGKGLVQSVYTLSYGAGLALTTARYYTPSGRWIQRDYSDLLAYVNPGDPDAGAQSSDEAPHGEGALFYTDAGRIVYAQGGITPDVIVKNDRDSKLLQQLLARYAFFNFAVDWLARHPNVSAEFDVTPEMRDDFFKFVENSSKYSTAAELKKAYDEDPNRALVDLAIRIEVANAKFGPEAGRRAFVSGDPQIQKALGLFGEASRIAALPKKKREMAVKAGG
ncbi:MAG TPA: S41 family peptidase [Thermoanaerobaculia bacterium]|nr:S41 family peptidase [Thermoanaerobaculia bacterium]